MENDQTPRNCHYTAYCRMDGHILGTLHPSPIFIFVEPMSLHVLQGLQRKHSSSAFLPSTGLTCDRAHSFITSFHFMAAFLSVCHCVPLCALRSSLFLHQTKQLSKCASALSSTHSPAFSSKEKEGRKASQCQGHACSSEELGCSQGQAHRFLA